MQRRTATVVVMTLGIIGLLATAIPALEIGSAAPDLRLPGSDGINRSLADADGPIVVIFFRGLW